jgi:uncharacterized protein YjbI with pentapeptide repeats
MLRAARSAVRVLLRGQRSRTICFATAIAAAFAGPALGRSHLPAVVHAHQNKDDLSAAEQYAWGQIKLGLPANFSLKCEDWLDPKQGDNPGWRDESKCRTLSSTFVVDILTKPPFRDAMTYKGVDIRGAKIVGDVDLGFAHIVPPVQITESRFEGDLSLRYGHAENLIELDGSVVTGQLDATAFHSEGELSLLRTTISEAGMVLDRVTIAGLVVMTGVTCAGDVGGSLFMGSAGENKASFKKVSLRSAKVTGLLSMVGTSLDGDLNADRLQAGGLYMRSDDENKANFKNVILRGAKVVGQLSMDGASLDGDLNADGLQVGGFVTMGSSGKNKASFKNVILRGAKIDGQLSMIGATFNGDLDADSLQVGQSLLMRSDDKNMASFKKVILRGAKITGQVDLGGANILGDLDANSVEVGGALLMNSLVKYKIRLKVNLSNAKVNGQITMVGRLLKTIWTLTLCRSADLYTCGPKARIRLLLRVYFFVELRSRTKSTCMAQPLKGT